MTDLIRVIISLVLIAIEIKVIKYVIQALNGKMKGIFKFLICLPLFAIAVITAFYGIKWTCMLG